MISGYAIDLGGTKIAAARIIAGRVEDRIQVLTDANAGLEEQVNTMATLLGSLGYVNDARLGVAVAGRIDSKGNWHAVNKSTLTNIGGQNLSAHLKQHFGSSVCVMNDAQAAALAEAKLGAGVGAEHFAYLTVSTGVGGGVVLHGKPVLSRNGLAGHLGFVSSPHGTTICGSGRKGTVEATASGKAIALHAQVPDAKAAFESGSALAEEAIDRSAAAIATLCGDLNAIFGLDKIAIGGSVGLATEYLNRVEAKLAIEPELFRLPIVPAQLGQDSALLGVLLGEGE